MQFYMLVGYSERDIQYKWNPARSVVIASDMKLSMFDVTDTPTGNLTERQRKGKGEITFEYHQ